VRRESDIKDNSIYRGAMARVKQTAKRLSTSGKESFSNTLSKISRQRRVNRNLSMLRQIHKAQDCVKLCIQRAPF
jgi:hypothetical protein